MREKLDYIHTNPVKRKLVMHPKDWPWSSWAYYARGEQGVVMIEPTGEERGEKKAHPLQKPQRAGHPHHPGLGRVEWRCSRTCHRKNEMKG
jgi:hypothetical protein